MYQGAPFSNSLNHHHNKPIGKLFLLQFPCEMYVGDKLEICVNLSKVIGFGYLKIEFLNWDFVMSGLALFLTMSSP